MNLLYGALAVVIIGLGAYFYMNETPADDDAMNTSQESMDMVAEDTGDEDEMSDDQMMDDHSDDGAAADHDDSAADSMDDATIEVETETETMLDTPVADVEADMSAEAEAHVFSVTGRNYAFDVTEIRVKQGDTVTINFESSEGFHDWVVDEFDAATAKVQAGQGVTSVTFVADQAGTYEYYCSVGSHRQSGMVGTLIVE